MQIKHFVTSLGDSTYKYSQTPDRPSVFFMPGHKNTFDSHKGQQLEKACHAAKLGFFHYEYLGWGGATSEHVPQNGAGYTSLWLSQALELFDALTTGPQILAGYSMGGYLQLALAALRPERVIGIVGIAAGFGRVLCEEIRDNHAQSRIYPHQESDKGFGFTLQADGSNTIEDRLPILCPVRLMHSLADGKVSFYNTTHISNAVATDDVNIHLKKSGSHKLDDPADTLMLTNILKEISAT